MVQEAEAEKKDAPMADADAAEATADEAAPNGSAAPDSAGTAPMETDGSPGKPDAAPQVGNIPLRSSMPHALSLPSFATLRIACFTLCSRTYRALAPKP